MVSLFTVPLLLMFAVLGSLAGFLAGLLGIGGGVILVPMFLWSFHLLNVPEDILVHSAFATSLAIIIPTAISSTLGHRKRGNVNWHQVFRLGIAGAIGAVIGGTLASLLSGDILKGLFGIMQILVAAKLLFFRQPLPENCPLDASTQALLGVGLVSGAFSAFFGVGGGVVAVPLMVVLLCLPIHLAVGNSSALIVLSSLFGTLSYIYHGWHHPLLPEWSLGYVSLPVALIVAPFSMGFARIGVKVASWFSHDKLVVIFSWLLIVIGLRMIYKGFF